MRHGYWRRGGREAAQLSRLFGACSWQGINCLDVVGRFGLAAGRAEDFVLEVAEADAQV